jgi:hypothetical protein
MKEDLKPVLPLRVGALLKVSSSIPVQVLAGADRMDIRAPFGDLTVPYAMIAHVTRNANGSITLDLAGATMMLDCNGLPHIALDALCNLLQNKERSP